jgi:hypothetical protein
LLEERRKGEGERELIMAGMQSGEAEVQEEEEVM